jgi:membrane-associated phospholipid phosphatase
MENKITIFDDIGFFGPFILVFITVFFLWSRTPYLVAYLVCIFMNSFINKLLKVSFREPRPNDPVFYSKYEKLTNEERFGMPSGHAQSVAYSTSFLYLATKSTPILLSSLFISSLTLYQRFKFRKHTIGQLAMGSQLGMAFGGSVYHLVSSYLRE